MTTKFAGLAATVLLAAVVGGCGGKPHTRSTPPATPTSAPAAAPTTSGSTGARDYLALGDSVSFGYREPHTTPSPLYADAATFVGFPQQVGAALGFDVANASCPGETSASLVRAGAPSNGCENSPGGGPGYRTAYPLHVAYSGTQLAFAQQYLRTHSGTRLVTLMIGANDGFLCQRTTKDGCVSEVSALLAQVGANVTTILRTIRTVDDYRGQVVVVDYYSLNYTSPLQNFVSQELNTAVNAAAAPFTVSVADGYGAFKLASAPAGGDTCKAGLLTKLTTGGCGVHPSAAGQALLAATVERSVAR